MKYVDEFRDKGIIKEMATKIKEAALPKARYRFMEVCGTHTMSIARFGLREILPKNVELISGPGCPVCVTSASYIDKAISLSKMDKVIVATFGDMLKVPGQDGSLEEARGRGSRVKIVYSTLDALELARKNPEMKIVFLGVGFETTVPTIAAAIKKAKEERIDNFFVLSSHKTMPNALKAIVSDASLGLNGFIMPAHVSTIIGASPYNFIAKKYKIPCVITGFEPLDIMQGIYMLIEQILKNKPQVEIQYSRVVKSTGNRLAQKMINDVFKECDCEWRGLGVIPKSGLCIKDKFAGFDAEKAFNIKIPKESAPKKGCICGDILKGKLSPDNCRSFAKECTPQHPIGPCMVSSEGTCSAWYQYRGTHD